MFDIYYIHLVRYVEGHVTYLFFLTYDFHRSITYDLDFHPGDKFVRDLSKLKPVRASIIPDRLTYSSYGSSKQFKRLRKNEIDKVDEVKPSVLLIAPGKKDVSTQTDDNLDKNIDIYYLWIRWGEGKDKRMMHTMSTTNCSKDFIIDYVNLNMRKWTEPKRWISRHGLLIQDEFSTPMANSLIQIFF